MLSICGEAYAPRELGCVKVVLDERSGVIAEVRECSGRCDYDYGGSEDTHIAPALIDMHVHLRGLMLSYKEDEARGTARAALAGIGLVADMPNTVPPLRSKEALLQKIRVLDDVSAVDYLVYAGVPRRDEVGELLELRKYLAGLKVYPEDYSSAQRASSLFRANGLPVVLHAESPELAVRSCNHEDCDAESRGCHVELAGLLEALDHGVEASHVTHASCPSTVLEARRLSLTVDATPHHLLLTAARGCLYRVNPPLRVEATRLGLLKLLIEGYVDAVASDHAPHTWREKLSPNCPPGIASLSFWPWILYGIVASGALSRSEFYELTSRRPAAILGLEGYGVIAPGARGNIVVVREEFGRVIDVERPHPYWGWKLAARPILLTVGGRVVMSEGRLVSRAGRPARCTVASRLG